MAEYFEVGCSRQVPWPKRPQPAPLLAALGDPANRIDAIVVGEYERAFDTGQLDALRPILERHGVGLWLPEAGGPVEFGSPLHEALAAVPAARSHAEVVRARHRVVAAMRLQTVEQGRYLGGRPPCGYRLVDAGPHPNRALARRGVRVQRFAPDPSTASHVRWIFSQRLAGRSCAHIARRLNERAIPGPSGAGDGWSLRTVTEILRNPRYTGYQVWNRTSADRTDRSATGRRPTTRNSRHEWALSRRIAHQPLVSEQDFLAAQTVHAGRPNAEGGKHVYVLTGSLHCAVCGRRMDAHRVHDRPGYRCRHGHPSARTRPDDAPRNLYLREDHLLARIADHLTSAGIAANPTPVLHVLAVLPHPRVTHNVVQLCRFLASHRPIESFDVITEVLTAHDEEHVGQTVPLDAVLECVDRHVIVDEESLQDEPRLAGLRRLLEALSSRGRGDTTAFADRMRSAFQ
ncbi:recombinase family protein [Actinosynnema sp. NPDC050801]|uniref:recombinase family protein n=1 Tax=unclassified Actinosynnema TaxID=2637065 RepID=UPI0033DB91FD